MDNPGQQGGEISRGQAPRLHDIDEQVYVRKVDINEDVKETQLQGLNDRLAVTENEEADALRSEIEDLEDGIDKLTGFRTGSQLQ